MEVEFSAKQEAMVKAAAATLDMEPAHWAAMAAHAGSERRVIRAQSQRAAASIEVAEDDPTELEVTTKYTGDLLRILLICAKRAKLEPEAWLRVQMTGVLQRRATRMAEKLEAAAKRAAEEAKKAQEVGESGRPILRRKVGG